MSAAATMSVPSSARTRDHREVLGRHRAVGNQPEIVAPVVRLAEDQARLPVVAADEEDIDARGLHLRDQRGVLRFARA